MPLHLKKQNNNNSLQMASANKIFHFIWPSLHYLLKGVFILSNRIYDIDHSGLPLHCSKNCPKPNQILFEAATGVEYLKSIWRRKMLPWGRWMGGGLYDLSLHPDQYYILVSETNYPPGLGAQLTRWAPAAGANALASLLGPARFWSHLRRGWWEGGFWLRLIASLESLASCQLGLWPPSRPPHPREYQFNPGKTLSEKGRGESLEIKCAALWQ